MSETMPTFRTPIKLKTYPFTISHTTPILSMGSCFAVQMARRLQSLKFEVRHNPFGILYHPHSIAHSLRRLLDGRPYEVSELFEVQGRWSHFDFHSSFAATQPQASLEQMNTSLKAAAAELRQSSLLVITLGTAYAWWHKKEARIVANCHKLPTEVFERRLFSVEEMQEELISAIRAVRAVNPDIRCLFTVSPIRHIRDGMVENQLSKSSLRVLAHQLCTRLPECYYFPSYEMMMDDLRDYRFYARDMLHPSEEALDYIWTHFQAAFFSVSTRALIQQIDKINLALSHRPHFPDSEGYQRFQQKLLQQMEALEQKFSFISFLSEKEHLLS